MKKFQLSTIMASALLVLTAFDEFAVLAEESEIGGHHQHSSTESERIIEHQRKLHEWGFSDEGSRVFSELAKNDIITAEHLVRLAFQSLNESRKWANLNGRLTLEVPGDPVDSPEELDDIRKWQESISQVIEAKGISDEDAVDDERTLGAHKVRFAKLQESVPVVFERNDDLPVDRIVRVPVRIDPHQQPARSGR